MKHFFLDANVALDFLARRVPFDQEAKAIFLASWREQVTLYVSSLSFANILYLLHKQVGAVPARQLVARLKQLVTSVAVDAAVVRLAVVGPFADFEDGLQHYAAVAEPAIAAIVTRNLRDFAASALPVLSPAQALTELAA